MKNKFLSAIFVIALFTSFTVSKANDAPSVTSLELDHLSGITHIFEGTQIKVTFSDDATAGNYTVVIDWGDNTTSSVTITNTGAGSYTTDWIYYDYPNSGVFEIKATVTDGLGASSAEVEGTSTYQYLAVTFFGNDFTHQSGSFNAPSGSLVSNPGYTGKVNMASACKPNANGSNKGDLDLSINGQNFAVKATNPATWDYLTISGCCFAIFKGNVTVNGAGGYKVLVAQTDRNLSCGGYGGNNMIRVKVWNTTGNVVLFDSQPGDGDNALPTTSLSNGSVGVNAHYICRIATSATENVFDMGAYPNPSSDNTLVHFSTASASNYKINLYDVMGQKVFEAQGVSATGENVLTINTSNIGAGIYHLQLNAGNETGILKLMVAR